MTPGPQTACPKCGRMVESTSRMCPLCGAVVQRMGCLIFAVGFTIGTACTLTGIAFGAPIGPPTLQEHRLSVGFSVAGLAFMVGSYIVEWRWYRDKGRTRETDVNHQQQ